METFVATVKEYNPKPEALETILNHIWILCDRDENVFSYFCKWIGQMLKYPEVKRGRCPVWISEEGAGKGSLFDLLRKMMGPEKVLETTNP